MNINKIKKIILFQYNSNKKFILWISLILLLILFIILLDKYVVNECNKVCDMLYVEKNNKKYNIIFDLFDKKFCMDIINEAEEYALVNEWKTNRHTYYPTVDNLIVPEMRMYEPIMKKVKSVVFKKIAELYNISSFHLGINEIFIVKYSIGGQTSLELHRDGSEFSFVIGLNNEFEGGGTYFEANDSTIKLDIGDCLIFSGQNKHRGLEIKSGKRYILAGFLHYVNKEYCKNYLNDEN